MPVPDRLVGNPMKLRSWFRVADILGMALAIGLVLQVSCGPRGAENMPPVLLISIDTCRADYLGCYGYQMATTPNIDAFAQDALLFSQVLSPVPLTLPAHCSIMTGRYPPGHGVHDNMTYHLAAGQTTLAEILLDQGYSTAAVTGAFVLDSQFGLNQGFTEYDDRFEPQPGAGVADLNQRRAGDVTARATRWLEHHCDEPFFLFLHYYDPHAPYDPPAPFAQRFAENLYAGEIAYTDHCVGEVLEKLKALERYEESLIIITADHGEGLGDHGEAGHDFFIYESTVRVPLIVKLPGRQQPLRIEDRVSLSDVVPTVLGALGRPIPPNIDGEDLSGYQESRRAGGMERELYCESLTPTSYAGSPLLGIVMDRWKYIEAPRPELYDLLHDPQETRNLAAEDPARADYMCRRLQEQLVKLTSDPQDASVDECRTALDPAARERLASLGYLSGRAVSEDLAFDRTKQDPKDLIGFHQDLQTTVGLIGERQYANAREVCARMLAAQPGIADVHILLGDMAYEEGQLDEAVQSYREYIRLAEAGRTPSLSPNRVKAHYNLANVLAELGEPEAGLREYERALEINPNHLDARHNCGLTLAEMGRLEGAIAQFQAALDIKPAATDIRLDLCRALAFAGRPAEADQHLIAALQMGVDSAPLAMRLGDVLMAQGRMNEAVEQYAAATRMAPNFPEAQYKLAHGLLGVGRAREAIRTYRQTLSIFPDWSALANELAWILATHNDARCRDGREALRIGRDLCKAADNREPMYLETLAAAYAELGRFDEALRFERMAFDLAQASGAENHMMQAIRARMDLLRKQQPVRSLYN